MRRLRAWAAALALLAAADAVPARAAEPAGKGVEAASSAPWYRRIFGGSADKSKPPPKAAARPQPKEVAAKTLQEESAVYLQRMSLCDRFRVIATETDNDELRKQADELEKQAWAVYQKKVAHLPGTKLTSLAADESLDRRLGTGVEAKPLRSAIKQAKGESARADRASAKREENP